jgi:Tol biopolymer transport system component
MGAHGTSGVGIFDSATQETELLIVPGRDPRWSPDGAYIAAVASDTQELKLFNFRNQTWGQLPTGLMHYPMWSRDSKYVYYGLAGIGSPDICRVRIADRKVEKLVDLKGVRIAYLPAWGPGWG